MLFSIKATQLDPWEEVKESGISNGDVLNVTVTNIREYGAFVDIGNGVEGFLHISEISWNSNSKIEDLLSVGDEINIEVIDLDLENRRLRVSYKSLLPKPAEKFAQNYREGDIVKGKVYYFEVLNSLIQKRDYLDDKYFHLFLQKH
jgi:small subunit ribosomal protein S1